MKLRFGFVILLMMLTVALCPTYASAASTPLDLSYGTPATASLEEEGYTWDGLTLTLSNLSLSTGSANAITITGVPSNTTSVVVLEGSSTLSSSGYALTTSGRLAIEGTGSLSIASGKVSCSALFTEDGSTLNLAGGTSLASSGIILNRGKITGSGTMSVPSGTYAINFGSGSCSPTITNASTETTGGTISVNSSWLYTLFYPTQSGDGWEWSSKADTLTLSGGSIFRFSSGSLMDLPTDTTVIISGNVTIVCDDANSAALVLGSSNSLQINSGATLTILSKGYGITSTNAVSSTSGSLNILSVKDGLNVSQGTTSLGSAYISSEATGFTTASGTLAVSGGTAISGHVNGVYLSKGGLTVNDGAVLFARTTSSGGHAIYTGGSVTVNGAIGLHSAGNGIYAPSGSITLNNGHLVANVDGNPLLFSNGTYTMTGGSAVISSLTNGIYAPNGITLSGGATVTIARADHSGVVATNGAIALSGGSHISLLTVGVTAVNAAKGLTLDAESAISVTKAGQNGVQVSGGNLTLTNGSSISVTKAGSAGVTVNSGTLTTSDGSAVAVGTTGGNGIYVNGDLTIAEGDTLKVENASGSGISVNGAMTTPAGATVTVTKAGSDGISVRDLADLDGTITVEKAGGNAVSSTAGSIRISGDAALTADKIGLYAYQMITTFETCTLTIDAGTDGVVTAKGAVILACAPDTPMTITSKSNGVVSGSTANLSQPGQIYIVTGSIGVKAESTIEAGGSPDDTSFLAIESTTYSLYSTDGNINLYACRDAYLFDCNVYTNSDNRKTMTLGNGAAIFYGLKTNYAIGIVRKDLVLTAEHTGDFMSLSVLQVGNGYTFTIASDATIKTGPIVTGLETRVVAEPGSTVFYSGAEGVVEGATSSYLTTSIDLTTTSAIEAAAATNDSISWDSATSTLTLDGLVLDVDDGPALEISDDVTIALTSTPSIISTSSSSSAAVACDGDLTLTGSGSLTITGGQTALSVAGDLNLAGASLSVAGSQVAAIATTNLTMTGGSLSVAADANAGIVATGEVSLANATVTLQSDGTALQAFGGGITITDSDVTAYASDVAIRAGGNETGRVVATNSTLNLNSDDTAVAAYIGSGSPAGVLMMDMGDNQRIATQDGWAIITEDDVPVTALAIDDDATSSSTSSGDSTGTESAPLTMEEEFADLGDLTISTLEDGTIVAEFVQEDGVIVVTTVTPEGVIQSTITLPEDMEEAVVTIPTPDNDPSALIALLVAEDESTTPFPLSVPTDTGLVLTVTESCIVNFEAPTIYFTDVAQGTWYHDSVYYVAYRNLFTGTTEDTYSPDQAITRSELVNAMWQLSGAQESTRKANFSDLSSSAWYYDAVNWCTEQGLVEGINGNFAPDQSITRQELATFLYRYVTFLGLDTSGRGDLYRYVDGDEVGSWADDAMAWAVAEGIITGRNGSMLDPTGTTTRAEVSAMFQRCILFILDM